MPFLPMLGNLLTPESQNPDYIAPSSVHVYTPEDALADLNTHKGTTYKSVDEAIKAGEPIKNTPIYTDSKGNDITDKFTSSANVPMKQPGVFQRLLNPTAAQRETDINAAYNVNKEQPYLSNIATLANTAGNISTGDKASVQDWTQTSPYVRAAASEMSPIQEKGRQALSNIRSNLAPITTQALTTGAGAATAQNRNAYIKAIQEEYQGTPALQATAETTEAKNYVPQSNEALRRFLNAGSLSDATTANLLKEQQNIVPAQQQLQSQELSGANDRQPLANIALLSRAMSEAENAPFLRYMAGNEARGQAYNSQVQAANPFTFGNRVNPDGTVTPNSSAGTIPNFLAQLRLMSNPDIMKSSQVPSGMKEITLSSGKKGYVPNVSKLPVKGNEVIQNPDGSITVNGKTYTEK
jgi:hypothetical protein